MNEHKFCFIICANNERYLEECLYYIDNLAVPEGYETERIVIWDAVSMTSGYNRAMAQSDAKYKIYLHQDVYVTNENVISDLLDIFKESSVGMVGAVGKQDFMASAEYTLNWDTGGVEVSGGINSYYPIGESGETEMPVDVIGVDGVFIATQYDLRWDENTFDGWDFYDMSQSMNFKQAGYRIVVPCIHKKENIWIYHDKGRSEYSVWEHYRKIFCETYQAAGYEYTDAGRLMQIDELEKQRTQIMEIFQKGDFEMTNEALKSFGKEDLDIRLCYVAIFLLVRQEEMTVNGTTRFRNPDQLQNFIDIYDEVKFMCRRIYFGYTESMKEEAWENLKKKLYDGEITMRMVWIVSQLCVGDSNGLWWNLHARFQRMIRSLIIQGEIGAAEQFLMQIDKEYQGKEGNILMVLISVFRREIEKGVSPTIFDVSQDVDELVKHYIRLKLYLRRLEFGLPVPYQEEVYEYCKKTWVSDHLILHILRNNIFYKEDFCRNLSRLFAREEGVGSMRANLYAQLAEK